MAAAAEKAAAGALLAVRAGAMSREHHQPTEPPHLHCGAHWDRAARAAAATQSPPGTHSLARRPGAEGGRRQRRERDGKRERGGWSRGRGRKPCAKGSVSRVNPETKLFQFKHLLSSPFPRRSGSPESGLRRRGRGKPSGWRASTATRPRSPPPVAAQAAAAAAAAAAPPRTG